MSADLIPDADVEMSTDQGDGRHRRLVAEMMEAMPLLEWLEAQGADKLPGVDVGVPEQAAKYVPRPPSTTPPAEDFMAPLLRVAEAPLAEAWPHLFEPRHLACDAH